MKDRAVAPSKLEFVHVKNLPYLEILSKANYKTKKRWMGMVRSLYGAGVQLTGGLEFEAPEKEVDEATAVQVMKDYTEAGK